MTDKVTELAIELMVERLVDRFDPDQIILFGSQARGTAGPGSDVDLLVIMPVSGSKRAKQLEHAHGAARYRGRRKISSWRRRTRWRGAATSSARSSGRRCARGKCSMLDLDEAMLEVVVSVGAQGRERSEDSGASPAGQARLPD